MVQEGLILSYHFADRCLGEGGLENGVEILLDDGHRRLGLVLLHLKQAPYYARAHSPCDNRLRSAESMDELNLGWNIGRFSGSRVITCVCRGGGGGTGKREWLRNTVDGRPKEEFGG